MITWDTQFICSIIFFAGMITIVILERFLPYTKGLPFFRQGFWIDFVWYTAIQSFVLKLVYFNWIFLFLKDHFGLSSSGYISHWPVWTLVLLFLVTHDFYIYWFHRLQHTSKLFWRTHEAHHSVQQVDWLAGSRSHAFEIIINQTIEFAPIFLLLDAETAAIVVPIKVLLDALWGQFIHSNIDVKLGRLAYLINGPEMHQWHHADHIEVYHANYATKFSFYDWLFNTAYLPGKKPLKFGLWYEYPKDYFLQHWFSFFRFDVQAVENLPKMQRYLDLRQQLMKTLSDWAAGFLPSFNGRPVAINSNEKMVTTVDSKSALPELRKPNNPESA
jgi:sterol desaturase/sphingolipid hydroxylase (fatty acid hydroxylase superfamily)